MVFIRAEQFRHADPDRVRTVWKILESMNASKQYALADKLVKALRKETGLKDDQIRLLLDEIEGDGLIVKSLPSDLTKGSPDSYRLPTFSLPCERGKHDWYCFKCHKAGEMRRCSECFRVYHTECALELKRQSSPIRSPIHDDESDFTCPVCDSSPKCEYSRKQIRKLLDFATHHLKKGPLWKLFRTIGFNNDINKNEYLVYKYLDLELLQQKIRDGRYTALESFALDVELLVHDVCILYGPFSNEADQARFFLRSIKSEIYEIELCTDCYINAKAKPSEWISKPCKPAHELIWASHRTTSGAGMFSDAQIAHFYWPAKILLEKDHGFEIRFFGGTHERMFAQRENTKPFKTPLTQLEVMRRSSSQGSSTNSGGFERAWSEVNKLQANIDSGYYTHSSGESDLPPSDVEYSDELYLEPRRGAVLSSRRQPNSHDSPRSSSVTSSYAQRKRNASSTSSQQASTISRGAKSGRASRGGKATQPRPVVPKTSSSLNAVMNALAQTKAALSGKKIKPSPPQPMFRGINYPGSPKSSKSPKRPSKGAKSRPLKRKQSSSVGTRSSTTSSLSSVSSSQSSIASRKKTNLLTAGTSTRPRTSTIRTKPSPSSSSDSSNSSSANSQFKAFKSKKPATPEESTVKSKKVRALVMNGGRKSIRSAQSSASKPDVEKTVRKATKHGRRKSGKQNHQIGGEESDLTDRCSDSSVSTNSNASRKTRKKKRSKTQSSKPPNGGPSTPGNNPGPSKFSTTPAGLIPCATLIKTSNPGPNGLPTSASIQVVKAGQQSLYTTISGQGLPTALLQATPGTGNLTLTTGSQAVLAAFGAASGANSAMFTAAANLASTQPLLQQTGKQVSPQIPRSHLPPNKRAVAEAAALAMCNSPGNQTLGPTVTTTTATSFYPAAFLAGQTTQTAPGNLLISPSGQVQLIPTNATDLQAAANALAGLTTTNAKSGRQNKTTAGPTTVTCVSCKEREKTMQNVEAEQKRALAELEERLTRHFQEEKSLAVRQSLEQAQKTYKENLERMQNEHREALEAAELRMNETMVQTKRRQWCRNCLKEAIYHCCWNTSYCSIPCQQEHWQKEHKRQSCFLLVLASLKHRRLFAQANLLEDAFDVIPSGLKFCFNREVFLDDYFDPMDFLRQQHLLGCSMEQVYDSLLQYSNVLKNGLVELINRDYSVFVKLSQNLNGLDKTMVQLAAPYQQYRAQLDGVKTDMQQRISKLESLLDRQQTIQSSKHLIRDLTDLHTCVETLESWLETCNLHCTAYQHGALPDPSPDEEELWPQYLSFDSVGHQQGNPNDRFQWIVNEFIKMQYLLAKCPPDNPIVLKLVP
ncbi:Conserved oligomeric Golgi complex subunit 2, partial [Cichlidogyrus casuarinus]